MSKHEKLLLRLLCIPSDFTWEELINLLGKFGYEELKKGKTGGSRRKLADKNNDIIILHKPHPGNIVKQYALRQVIQHLQEQGHIL